MMCKRLCIDFRILFAQFLMLTTSVPSCIEGCGSQYGLHSRTQLHQYVRCSVMLTASLTDTNIVYDMHSDALRT